MSIRAAPLALLLLLPLAPAAAFACGVCIEDKVAATYDHAVITRAAQRHHVVVFAALEGSSGAQALAREARSAAARVRSIDVDSVRSAAEPPALSFAFDPSVQSAENAMRDIERQAGAANVKLTLLRVVR